MRCGNKSFDCYPTSSLDTFKLGLIIRKHEVQKPNKLSYHLLPSSVENTVLI